MSRRRSGETQARTALVATPAVAQRQAVRTSAAAKADIGIAVGVPGTDVALETADVALVGDDLRLLLNLRGPGLRTLQIVRRNYGMSIAVDGADLLVGAAGALSPVPAAVLHNAPSVAVAVDSAPLIRYRGTAGQDGPAEETQLS